MDSIGEFKKPDQGNVPEGVKGWSWGAFLLSWVWAIGNRTWIGLLCLLPFIGFIFAIILGIKGREWAWKNKKWQDLDHFNRVQRDWSLVGLWILYTIISSIIFFAFGIYKNEAAEKAAADADRATLQHVAASAQAVMDSYNQQQQEAATEAENYAAAMGESGVESPVEVEAAPPASVTVTSTEEPLTKESSESSPLREDHPSGLWYNPDPTE